MGGSDADRQPQHEREPADLSRPRNTSTACCLVQDRQGYMLNGNAPGPYFCIVAIGLYYLNFIFINFYLLFSIYFHYFFYFALFIYLFISKIIEEQHKSQNESASKSIAGFGNTTERKAALMPQRLTLFPPPAGEGIRVGRAPTLQGTQILCQCYEAQQQTLSASLRAQGSSFACIGMLGEP